MLRCGEEQMIHLNRAPHAHAYVCLTHIAATTDHDDECIMPDTVLHHLHVKGASSHHRQILVLSASTWADGTAARTSSTLE